MSKPLEKKKIKKGKNGRTLEKKFKKKFVGGKKCV